MLKVCSEKFASHSVSAITLVFNRHWIISTAKNGIDIFLKTETSLGSIKDLRARGSWQVLQSLESCSGPPRSLLCSLTWQSTSQFSFHLLNLKLLHPSDLQNCFQLEVWHKEKRLILIFECHLSRQFYQVSILRKIFLKGTHLFISLYINQLDFYVCDQIY